MWTRNAAPSNASAPLLPVAGATAPAPSPASTSAAAKPFAQVLQQAQSKAAAGTPSPSASKPQPRLATGTHTISAGETLIGLVRDQAQARGVALSGPQEMRLAQQLASSNRIGNADLVYPGQSIDLSALHADLQSMPVAAVRRLDAGPQAGTLPANPAKAQPLAYDVRSRNFTPAASAVAQSRAPIYTTATVPVAANGVAGAAHPVLQQTLDRAVAKGFIPPSEKAAVYDKILEMADNHRFSPDDFARMTLMESDGMNPRASNQRCHGIIQFCDGPARGAASAGYGANPRAILDLSVHKQLSLVDKYFDDVGLKSQGPAGLEDLYLSVLNPASRAEAQSNAPLNIGGQQARALHVGNDTAAPITRQSIRQGLLQNAAARLGQMLPNALRVQAQRAQQYVENTLP